MSLAQENAITSEFHRLIGANHLRQDIGNQVRLWKEAAGTYIKCTSNVYNRVRDLIKEAKQLNEENARHERDLTMLALSLALVGPLGFVGGMVQYHVAPRVFQAAQSYVDKNTVHMAIGHFRGQRLKSGYLDKLARLAVGLTDAQKKSLGKAASGILGDIAGTGIKMTFPSADAAGVNADLNVTSLEDLRAAINKAIGEFETRAGNAVSEFSSEFKMGNVAKAILYENNQNLDASMKSVQSYVEWKRKDWHKEWTFYGNNPKLPPEERIEAEIERNTWALWLPASNIKTIRRTGKLVPSSSLPKSISQRFESLGIWTHAPVIKNLYRKRVPLVVEGDIDTFIEWESAVRWARAFKPTPLDIGKWGKTSRSLPGLDRLGS